MDELYDIVKNNGNGNGKDNGHDSVGSTAERRQSRDSSRLSKAQDDRRPKIFLMVWGLRMTDEQCKCGRVSWSECLFTFETSQRSPRAVPWCNSKPMQPWIAGWQLPSGKDGIGMSSLDWVKTLFIFPLSTSRRSNGSVTCHLAESQHPVVPLRRSTSPYGVLPSASTCRSIPV